MFCAGFGLGIVFSVIFFKMSEKCKEDLFWEINKRKLAFSGVLTVYVSEKEGEWKERTSFGVASSWDHLGHWESSSAEPALVCSSPVLRATPIQHQFKEAFPPHKSPLDPCCLCRPEVWVLPSPACPALLGSALWILHSGGVGAALPCMPSSPGLCSVDPSLWRNVSSCAQSQQTLQSSPGAKNLTAFISQSGEPVGSAGERSTSLGKTQENQKRWKHRRDHPNSKQC
ncbi:hypothetical protein IHE44_0007834 [Lamprotornis superbus]|uniref:Uncharacterized protein n=1 Tax=Lamprotornis superbus TaxID=245042 RepID=A0A835TTZ5_9PASS|nr:hypothetical protein IHE44_0007834 [Lamprotornis superbus]